MGITPEITVATHLPIKAGVIVISAALLGGCAGGVFSSSPPKIPKPEKPSDYSEPAPAQLTMPAALEYVSRIRKLYREAADTSVDSNKYFDIATILLGAAGTASAVIGASPVLTVASAGTGGSVLGLKTYADSKTKAKILLKGEAALLCVEQLGSAYDKLSADIGELLDLKGSIEGEEKDADSNAKLVRNELKDPKGKEYILNGYTKAKKAAKAAKKAIDDAIAASQVRAQTVYFSAKKIENKVAMLLINQKPDASAIAKGLAGSSKPTPAKPATATAKSFVAKVRDPREDLSANVLALEKLNKQANEKAKVYTDADKAIGECGKDLK